MKAAGWNRGFWGDPNNEADGCKLETGLVLTEMPDSAGSKGAEASIGLESGALEGDWMESCPPEAPVGSSERSASTTPIKNRRHKLVAIAPISPGLASNRRKTVARKGEPDWIRSSAVSGPADSPARIRAMTSPEKWLK